MAVDFLQKKAEFLLGGDVCIPAGYDDPLFEHRDGKPYSAVLTFGPCRARKRFSENGAFELVPVGNGYRLERHGEVFLEDVGVKQMFCHSPDLAVITLGKDGEVMPTEKALSLLDGYSSEMDLQGVSLHGGECSKEHYLEVVKSFHERYPALRIGIGPVELDDAEMACFMQAGASEFKITIQSPVRRVMENLGSGDVLEHGLDRLKSAVAVFGRNHVLCTFYIGQGETDDEFLGAIDEVCAFGILPDVKVKKSRAGVEPFSAERYVRIMKPVKEIIAKHNLDPNEFRTMCYGCRCCNIVPFKDF